MYIKSRTEGGSVKTIKIGNISISGIIWKIFNLNRQILQLIIIKWDKIYSKGYNHGVGMSQWGAEGMSQKGYKYYDILFHYYKDTKIKDLY